MNTYGKIEYQKSDYPNYPGAWKVTTDPAVRMRLKRIFPKVDARHTGDLYLISRPETARDLEWTLMRWPMEISRADKRRLRDLANNHRETEETKFEILAGKKTFDYIHEVEAARDYQRQAADLCVANKRLLLADDLGLGKSLTGLLLLRDPDTLPALVVTLTHLPRQWQGELGQWLPMLTGHILRNGEVYNPADRRELGGYDPDVIITSYSKLAKWGDFLAGKVKTVIFDECQELRTGLTTQKGTAARMVSDKADYVMGLTATPVYNYGGEIWQIFNIINPGALGSPYEFETEWGVARGASNTGVKDPAALGHWLRNEGLMLRRTRKDVGRELPETMRMPWAIDTDADVYDDLTADATNLAETILHGDDSKERFVAAGELDNRIRHATGVAKAPYVADFVRMLAESGEKVVMFGWHHDVYDIWKERLEDLKPVLYTGKESAVAKEESRRRFTEGDAQILMMSLRSGAGLDGLQEVAKVAVFGELDWSPGVHDQCIGRLHRDGQDESVLAYFLVSNQGADPPMADVLNLKRQEGELIRDPDAELLGPAPNARDRVKQLAEQYLANRKKTR